jgi:ribosomal protein S18 acetylase RimI-like enzyme
MSIVLTQLPSDEASSILGLLRDADEGEEKILAIITDPIYTSYIAREGNHDVGAATLLWRDKEAELIYIAIDRAYRGQGIGKQILNMLIDEAKQRMITTIMVGTGNSSLSNIAFYQKCGFRMDHIRHDYFSYIQPPIREDGIPLRDMLVFRYNL